MNLRHWVQIYFVPGAVLVSVIMGGGYGTGREVVEYFSQYGTVGGLLGISLATVIFGTVLSFTFEFARRFQVFDYKSFFKALIGPFWIVFEILYIALFILVLAVISSGASQILLQEFNVPEWLGMSSMLLLVAVFVLFGRDTIERLLALLCLGIYGVFGLYFYEILSHSNVTLASLSTQEPTDTAWLSGGFLYPFYNLAIAPVLLFTIRNHQNRKQSVLSAWIAAIMVMFPALLFHLSFIPGLPEVLDESIPNYWMIGEFGSPLLKLVFVLALFCTLIETGIGLIQGVVERVQAGTAQQALGTSKKLAITAISIGTAYLFGSLGIIALIAKGYSFLGLGFALVYVLPILSIGYVKLRRPE